MTILACAGLLAGCVGTGGGTVVIPGAVNYHLAAAASCGSAIADFEKVINGDADTGNLNKGVHRRIVADLASVKTTCSAGRDVDASRALAAVKSRYGYR
jgi:hypothetical protein